MIPMSREKEGASGDVACVSESGIPRFISASDTIARNKGRNESIVAAFLSSLRLAASSVRMSVVSRSLRMCMTLYAAESREIGAAACVAFGTPSMMQSLWILSSKGSSPKMAAQSLTKARQEARQSFGALYLKTTSFDACSLVSDPNMSLSTSFTFRQSKIVWNMW